MDPATIYSIIPLLFIWVIFVALLWPIARRKGVSRVLFIICSVPPITALYAVWLASKTDRSVLDRLAALEGKTK